MSLSLSWSEVPASQGSQETTLLLPLLVEERKWVPDGQIDAACSSTTALETSKEPVLEGIACSSRHPTVCISVPCKPGVIDASPGTR